VFTTDQSANGYAERCGQRRQDPLVGGLAGFEAFDGAGEHVCCRSELVDAVARCDAKAYEA